MVQLYQFISDKIQGGFSKDGQEFSSCLLSVGILPSQIDTKHLPTGGKTIGEPYTFCSLLHPGLCPSLKLIPACMKSAEPCGWDRRRDLHFQASEGQSGRAMKPPH